MDYLSQTDIDTIAKLNAILTDGEVATTQQVTAALEALKGNVPVSADSLEKLYNIVAGLNFLRAEDIDTLSELNAVLSDADLVRTQDLSEAISEVEPNRWGYSEAGNTAGVVSVDLSGKAIIKFSQTGPVTDFNFSGEALGRQYLFVIERSANFPFHFAAGRWSFAFGIAPAPTNPLSNGSSPAFARDIWTAVCLEAGRLTLIPSNNFLFN